MGGKGGSSTPSYSPPVETPGVDMAPLFSAMMQMQNMTAMMMRQNQQNMETMMAAAPKAEVDPSVNWSKRMEELRTKISGDMNTAASKRRGRESTVVTSPLTDDEVKLTESVLSGK